MKTLISSIFTKKYAIALTFTVLLISLSAFIKSSQNNPIVGMWIGINSTDMSNKTVYTAAGKFKSYYRGELKSTAEYKLSKKPNHCGADMSDRLERYPNEYILIIEDIQTEKKTCYLVYKLTEDRLIYSPFRDFTGGVDSLKKVQQ